MNKDLNIKGSETDFIDLAKQGILFLNSALTVESKPGLSFKIMGTFYKLYNRP